jgi:very-short-patch-repair endonuclease
MDSRALDARVALVARRQAGAFSWSQARGCGFGKATVGRRVRSGRWERVHPGVNVIAGTPRTRVRDLWVAVLAVGPDAVISHESAALVHGAERLAHRPVTLTVPHGSHHRLRGLVVHQIGDVARRHRTRVEGLPVVTAARAVVDLGSRLSVERLGDVADDLVQARATSWPAIGAVFSDVVRPGKPGMVAVATLLDERGGDDVPAQSRLEQALLTALAAGGLSAPVRQMPLPGRGLRRALADAAYPDARIVLEADGRRYHQRLADMRRDRERDAQVVKAGWVPLRFVYEQIVVDPAGVCADVAEARAVRLDQLSHRRAS